MANILIVGCGDIGTALGQRLAASGHCVTGLRRHPPATGATLRYIKADIADAATLDAVETGYDLMLFIVSAGGRSEPSYRAVYETGLGNVLSQLSGVPLVFVSSTSVYAQSRGEWVDEDSSAEPDTFNGRLLRAAEQRVLAAHPHNLIVRFSGIYGPGREHLPRLAATAPEIQRHPPYYTNRIHRDDCVGVLAFLSAQHLAGVSLDRYYLASDDDPAPLWDVVSHLAERLRCPPPAAKQTGDGAPMNKRCRNARLKALGYRFRYPSYKSGYEWVG